MFFKKAIVASIFLAAVSAQQCRIIHQRLKVVVAKENLTLYDDKEVQDHLSTSFNLVDRPLVDIRKTPMSCIDSRNTHETIGTPGGDFAEFLAGLKVLLDTNKEYARVLGNQRALDGLVLRLLALFIKKLGRPFYMHSSMKHLKKLLEEMKVDRLPRGAVPKNLSDWMEQVVKPQHVGCGHIRHMLETPKEYKMPVALTKALIRAVYRIYWSQYSDAIELDFYDGNLVAKALLVVAEPPIRSKCSSFFFPAVVPHVDDSIEFDNESLFVYHAGAAKQFRQMFTIPFIMSYLKNKRISPRALFNNLNSLAKTQLEHTQGILAKDLPVYEFRYIVDQK
jgi:hypothetical protein